MNKKNNISVVVVVYNEEGRIENFLKSFLWADEIIVVDKSSTDRTIEIARNFTKNIICVPYSDASGSFKIGIDAARNLWVLTLTASDIIHPRLASKILLLINDPEFDYDVISLPFAIYVFGISDPKRSPWNITSKQWLWKKNVIITSDEVHNETSHASQKIFVMSPSSEENLYHLTHGNLEIFLERHTRYARLEALKFTDELLAFKKCRWMLWRSIRLVLFKQKTYLLGWNGLALGLAYILYFILIYLFVWERFRGPGDEKYTEIRKKLLGIHKV